MQLVFDFITEIEKAEKTQKQIEHDNSFKAMLDKLVYYPDPKNDNELLLNYQHDYLHGDNSAWEKMWNLSLIVVHRMFFTQIKTNRLHYSADERYEKELSAVEYVLRRYKTKKNYFIKYNFLLQLKGGVMHSIYHRTEASKLVDFIIESYSDRDFLHCHNSEIDFAYEKVRFIEHEKKLKESKTNKGENKNEYIKC